MKKDISLMQYIKPLDWVLLLILTGIASYSAFSITNSTNPAYVVIKNRNNSWIYSLEDTETIHVEGVLGTTIIHIENKKVSFLDSPCPHKTCIAAGAISHSNQWTACLPNSVFAYIESRDDSDGIDAMSN